MSGARKESCANISEQRVATGTLVGRTNRKKTRIRPWIAACGCLGLGLVLSGTWLTAADPVPAPSAAQARLARDIRYLASDALEGRGIGTPGLDQAAEYIRQQFAEAGLNMQGVKGTPWQAFAATTGAKLTLPNQLFFRNPQGAAVEWQGAADFRIMSFGGSGQFAANIVFCGYGIDAPDKKYSDFAQVKLEGKVALILRRTPRQDQPGSPFVGPHGEMTTHSELRTKVSNAFSRGAVAILLVNDAYTGRKEIESAKKRLAKLQTEFVDAEKGRTALAPQETAKQAEAAKKIAALQTSINKLTEEINAGPTDSLMKFGYAGDEPVRTIPIYHITRAVADSALRPALNTTLAELEQKIDADLQPRSAPLPDWSAEGVVTIERTQAEVKNIIAVLPGKGPLAEETIVLGAHYDHIGRGAFGSLAPPGGNEIHNGADDNASGAVTLVEVARRLAARKEPLPRRVVFIAFTAEESGLIGSARYVREPVFPLEKTVAMLNMDMVGRLQDDRLTVFGTGTSKVWEPLIKRLGTRYHFQLSLKPEGFGPSDHSSFYAKQIPVLHFFTGTHADYHRPTDDVEKINVPGMSRVADLVEGAIVEIAQQPARPDYIVVKGMASILRDTSRPYFGSIPDFANDLPGCAISGVAPEGPADKGGLKGGDRIVQLGAHKIENLNDFDLALRKYAPGDTVDVVVIRGKDRVPLKVTLGKPRG